MKQKKTWEGGCRADNPQRSKKQNIFYQPLGNSWAVGIESNDPQEIILQDNSWYNREAYNGELHYLSDTFAYIWTTEKKIKNYFFNSSLAIIQNKHGDKLRGKTKRAARLLAHLRFNSMIHETFISVSNNDRYRATLPVGLGAISKQTGCLDMHGWRQGVQNHYNKMGMVN
jgi:hypothetical protein